MRRYRVMLIALFCIACFPELEIAPRSGDGFSGQSGLGTDSGVSDVGWDVLDLSVAEPFHGSNSGGLETYFEGGPFDESLRVWFADVEAEVIAVTESGARVIVPTYDGEGPVSIRVQTDEGEGETPLGFRYWEDQSGLTVVAGFLFQYDWMTDSGVGPSTAVSQIMPFQPTDLRVTDFLAPAVGNCGIGEEFSPMVSSPEDATITGGGIELGLERYEDTDILYYYTETQEPDLQGRLYDLALPTGGSYPEQTIPNAFQLSEDIRTVGVDISEYDTWLNDPDILNIASSDLRWAGATGEYVYLSFYDAEDPSRYFHCLVENDGSFTLSSSDFAGFDSSLRYGWENWDYLEGPYYDAYIRLIDIHITETVLDFNNGVASLVGGAGIVGQARFWDGR